MKFRTWLEIAEPTKPSGRVRKSNITKDKGTNVASPTIQFKWTTKLGNVVKLHFDHDGPDEYRVIFYVNETLYDDASSKEGGRDPEILSGIFYLLNEKADKIGAERLSFRAQKSDKDTRTIRNLDPEQYKMKAMDEFQKFSQQIQQHQIQMIPPSEIKINLWKKLNRGEPQPTPDFHKEIWIQLIRQLDAAIRNNERFPHLIDQLKTGKGTGSFQALNLNPDPLIAALTDLDNAIASISPEGWQRTKNRRTAIYTKLVQRHMADKWDIEISGDNFYLTRKEKSSP